MPTNIVVIAHGRSEMILSQRLSRDLKVPIVLYSRSNGSETISLSHLPDILSSPPFDGERSLHKAYPGLEYLPYSSTHMPNLAIVPIVDVDGDTGHIRSYLSKDMFIDSPFRNRIVPVLNNPNLEAVMEDIGYPPVIDKVRFYSWMELDAMDLRDRMRSSDTTNMERFIECLLSHSPSYQNRIDVR